MQPVIEGFLERIEQSDTLDDLYDAVCDLRGLLGVEHAVYHSVNRFGKPYALATYSAPWAAYYEGEMLYRIDPVVLGAFQRFHPYDWKSLDWESKQSRHFFLEAQDGGVGNQGISVPIRGPMGEFALFSLSHRCTDQDWARFLGAHRSNLLLIGHFLHEAVRRLDEAPLEPELINLSPRETESLQLLGAGLNRGRVAERLEISEHTLRVYVESARHKLQASNTTHAVAKAVSNGLIAL
ncbi:MAG: autoinducer binding domain-containing protein [Pseudomonadota bacterium]